MPATQRMLDVGLAGEPGLAGVRSIGDVEGATNRCAILRREVLDAGHELGDRHGALTSVGRERLDQTPCNESMSIK